MLVKTKQRIQTILSSVQGRERDESARRGGGGLVRRLDRINREDVAVYALGLVKFGYYTVLVCVLSLDKQVPCVRRGRQHGGRQTPTAGRGKTGFLSPLPRADPNSTKSNTNYCDAA
ncbi:unnamed protein product, partial [Brenthis ino]